MSGPIPAESCTFLNIVQSCDNFRLSSNTEILLPWLLTPSPSSPAVGLLRPEVVAQLRAEALASPTPVWEFLQDSKGREWAVSFAREIATPADRSRVMKDMCERWRDAGLFPDEIGARKWRNELYPVYRRPFGVRDCPGRGDPDAEADELNYAFRMERAASGLFGIVTYGVHMTVYEEHPATEGEWEGARYKLWVPRRAATKQTWPGYLDNSVAGGIEAGLGVFDCVVKEAMEEASIPEDVVRRHARATGSVSYFFQTPRGWLQPEIEYVYDLALPPNSDVQPKPLDGEVESFELLPLEKVIEHMRAGSFKYNCAIVIVDWMVRKGILTPDNEPDYQEIVTRLHGRFDHDGWADAR
ncbi:NUDIX hydrolase domain-like protein [Lenzites betulinus]|nr:NUDIX hydrolase domain-like protein [Lenzites betulinus]